MTTGLAIPPLELYVAKASLRNAAFERVRTAGGGIQAHGGFENLGKTDWSGFGVPLPGTRGQVFERVDGVRADCFPRGMPGPEPRPAAVWIRQPEDRSQVEASGAAARKVPVSEVPSPVELRGVFRPRIAEGDECGDLALVDWPLRGECRQPDTGGSTRN